MTKKTLKDFLEVYKPKSPDEQKFVDKHVVIKHKDRNGNGDDVFKGNTKTIKRKEERHGYDAGEDEKVYEALKGDQHKIDANKNGKVDAHDFKLLRKKKVAEEVEDLDELSSNTLRSYGGKALRAGLGGNEKRMKGANLASAKLYPKQYEKSPLKAKVPANEEVEGVDESYQELMALKNNIARNEKKMNSIPGIHPEKKRLAIQIEKDTKRHKALFNKQMGKNEEVDLGEAVTVNKKNYSWGKMVTVHQGSATTYPLHPEHQEKIRKLSDGDKTSFKDETGATVHAHRSGDTVHLKKPGSSNRVTAVAYSHFTEEVDIDTVLDEALDLLMSIDEKTLTPAEMKKREEVVKAIKRDDPKMDKSMAYAIATKTAKRVAEGTMPTADEPTDANKKTAQRIRDLLAKEKKPVKEDVDSYADALIKRNKQNLHKDHVVKAARIAGVDEKSLMAAVNKKVGRIKEEAEDLDESAKIAAHLIKRYGDNVRKSHVVSAANDFGVDASKLAKAVRTKLGKTSLAEAEELDELSATTKDAYAQKAAKQLPGLFKKSGETADGARKYYNRKNTVRKIANEEAEAIDELSVAKLKDYRTKARADAYDADDVDDERRYRKRAAGSNTAGKKIVRQGGSLRAEEAEGLDELSKGKMQDYMDKASDARGHRNLSTKKVDNRYAGVKKASDKLTKEEVEAIDELSKKTLGSYTYQAASQLGSRGITTGLKIANDEPTERNFKKMGNRQKGVATAVKKLTKEDIINRTIEKYVPEELKFTPEERLLKRLGGLSEAHVDTLLGLFEDLNKDNQNKMIETVESRDGINQLLNFVLENRGK